MPNSLGRAIEGISPGLLRSTVTCDCRGCKGLVEGQDVAGALTCATESSPSAFVETQPMIDVPGRP